MKTGKWEVEVKRSVDKIDHEISVLREDNELGHSSWGWFGEDKIMISYNGAFNENVIRHDWIFDVLVKSAHFVADELNKER